MPPPTGQDDRFDAHEAAWRLLGVVSEWVRFADAKAAAMLQVQKVNVVEIM